METFGAVGVGEVRGLFADDERLRAAIDLLTRAGFDRASLSLPIADAARPTPDEGARDPVTEDDVRQSRTLHGSLAASVGAMAGAGVVAATGGAALAAGAAALVLGAAAGGAVEAVHRVSDPGSEAARAAAAAAGELVLTARTPDAERATRAMAAMREAGAIRVESVGRTDGKNAALS